ncbi:MAG: TIGR03960 family B12-binding radical SAM protein [Firmicutes bacterium]|nr:TIGR03960 family B12-binding radical SAM protein [Bacillota bacterium]
MKNYKEIFWQEILPRLEKPTRYLGNEVNAQIKNHEQCTMRIALVFPDLYEIGMSHLGLKILYHLLNERPQWVAERVFMPGADLEKIMREENFPLCSLETVTPLAAFDLVGVTLQYELSYTTVLQMLDLAGIPLLAADRSESDPLVVGGGPGAFNPEPIAGFFDFFVIGDAEEVLPEIVQVLEEHKNLSRQERLLRLVALPGVYVPSLYEAQQTAAGTFLKLAPAHPSAPARVRRAVVADLDEAYYPTDFVVPYGSIVHDRLVLEIFRGCSRGCRFCQAGMIYRPVRERKKETLRQMAQKMVRSTGYEEVALSSLSSGDYSAIGELIQDLSADLAGEGVFLSLPSLRLDSFSQDLARQSQQVRKSGLTFAPEAGTQRLRDVINKNITEAELISAVRDAFAAGWTNIKLYFMLGLPAETDDDLLGIVHLVQQVLNTYKQAGGKGRPQITVSASVFVPKAHTPFQWFGQIPEAEIRRRQDLLRRHLRLPGVHFQWHGAEMSLLEAAIARGGRELVPVILRAAKLGCKLDSWDEHFRFDLWQQAFTENGLDLAACAQRQYALTDPLPWDHIDAGVSKRFLQREYERALKGETTKDCREGCLGCGIALLLDKENRGVCINENLD